MVPLSAEGGRARAAPPSVVDLQQPTSVTSSLCQTATVSSACRTASSSVPVPDETSSRLDFGTESSSDVRRSIVQGTPVPGSRWFLLELARFQLGWAWPGMDASGLDYQGHAYHACFVSSTFSLLPSVPHHACSFSPLLFSVALAVAFCFLFFYYLGFFGDVVLFPPLLLPPHSHSHILYVYRNPTSSIIPDLYFFFPALFLGALCLLEDLSLSLCLAFQHAFSNPPSPPAVPCHVLDVTPLGTDWSSNRTEPGLVSLSNPRLLRVCMQVCEKAFLL